MKPSLFSLNGILTCKHGSFAAEYFKEMHALEDFA